MAVYVKLGVSALSFDAVSVYVPLPTDAVTDPKADGVSVAVYTDALTV